MLRRTQTRRRIRALFRVRATLRKRMRSRKRTQVHAMRMRNLMRRCLPTPTANAALAVAI